MTGLDTNLLIRYFTLDDPVQSPRAAQIIEHRFDGQERGFVSLATVLEVFWVLSSCYSLSEVDAATLIERLLVAGTIEVQNEQQVFWAISIVKAGTGTFEDALIGALGLWAGCSTTLTFDRKAARLAGFQLA